VADAIRVTKVKLRDELLDGEGQAVADHVGAGREVPLGDPLHRWIPERSATG
jgi:hypothetical protein